MFFFKSLDPDADLYDYNSQHCFFRMMSLQSSADFAKLQSAQSKNSCPIFIVYSYPLYTYSSKNAQVQIRINVVVRLFLMIYIYHC